MCDLPNRHAHWHLDMIYFGIYYILYIQHEITKYIHTIFYGHKCSLYTTHYYTSHLSSYTYKIYHRLNSGIHICIGGPHWASIFLWGVLEWSMPGDRYSVTWANTITFNDQTENRYYFTRGTQYSTCSQEREININLSSCEQRSNILTIYNRFIVLYITFNNNQLSPIYFLNTMVNYLSIYTRY